MENSTKIIIGLGVAALAYWYFTKEKKEDSNFSNLSKGLNGKTGCEDKQGNVIDCPKGRFIPRVVKQGGV